jgi:hypothetical protein
MRSLSGRTRRALHIVPGLAAFLLATAAPASGALRIADVGGHLAFGYGYLFADGSPGGSLSIAGGLDVPLAPSLRAGVDVGYNLLGTRTEERGTLIAELDYGVFEALALLHWSPGWRGPLGRISIGPGVFNARADLSSSGGAAFSDLAVEETVAGGALALTFVSRNPSPVRVGLELGARVLFLDKETWTVATGRLAFLY